jgi:hypothetical protein
MGKIEGQLKYREGIRLTNRMRSRTSLARTIQTFAARWQINIEHGPANKRAQLANRALMARIAGLTNTPMDQRARTTPIA